MGAIGIASASHLHKMAYTCGAVMNKQISFKVVYIQLKMRTHNLVSSSALTEDFYQKALKKDASEKEIILVGRICVIIISAIALVLVLSPNDTILGIVAYAWGGFGAAFGPLVLFALFSRRTGWQAVLAGIVTGTVVLVVWKQVGLSKHMYEIVPGFICNCLTIFLVNTIVAQKDKKVLEQYEEVAKIIGTGE